MKIPVTRAYWWIAAAHFVLTIGGFYFVAAYAQGYADAGGIVAPSRLELLRVLVDGVLMQPLLYALLSLDWFRWWTTPGMVAFAMGALFNSVVAVGILWIVVRLARRIFLPIALRSRES